MTNTPQQFRDLAASAELWDTSEKIGNKFGLHIDQIGELDAEIRDILNGASRSSDFTAHIIERLEINRSLADNIVQEVNTVVFGAIKKQLQSMDREEPTRDISAIEKAGSFSLEKGRDVTGRNSKDDVTEAETRDALRNIGGIDIENSTDNPEPDHEPMSGHIGHHHAPFVPPEHLPGETTEPILGIKEDDHTDPVADHLMSNTVATVQEKSAIEPAGTQAKPGSDRYRESF